MFDGDQGPNTGGMGAYSPAPVMTPEMTSRAMDEIVLPTVRAMKAMGAPYKGVLYAGLMITARGPEADRIQRALRRSGMPGADAAADVGPGAGAAGRRCDGMLKNFDLRWYPDAALTVVMAAKGYPGNYAKGSVIEGLDAAADGRGRRDLPRRHQGRGRPHPRQWRARAQRLRRSARPSREAQARAYAAVDRIKLAGRLLPPRHRLARGGAGEGAVGSMPPANEQSMSDLADLFPGFASHWIDTSAGRIFARTGGEGPPLLLLHGYPQTNVMWHRVAPALAQHFTLIIPDLPGYGWSAAPASDAEHAPYTKRAMADAMVEVMEALGHVRFRLAGHDRGGRVAYRLALDHPGRLEKLAVLDIVPTWTMWHRMDARLAIPRLALDVPGAAGAVAGDPDRQGPARTISTTRAAAGPR